MSTKKETQTESKKAKPDEKQVPLSSDGPEDTPAEVIPHSTFTGKLTKEAREQIKRARLA